LVKLEVRAAATNLTIRSRRPTRTEITIARRRNWNSGVRKSDGSGILHNLEKKPLKTRGYEKVWDRGLGLGKTPKSNHTRLAHLPVTLSAAKGLMVRFFAALRMTALDVEILLYGLLDQPLAPNP
jgi:hypothetical protein